MNKQAKEKFCPNCGKLIQNRSTRCRICSSKYRSIPIEQRFWSKVDKNGPIQPHMITRCWKWLAYKDKKGYSKISFGGTLKLAHRISWIIENGTIPNNLDVLHKCDNPECTNPEHLFLGTNTDNMRDMASKGRTGTREGEQNNMSKLTREQVKEIKERSTFTSQVQLAKEYKVSQAAIWYILKGRNWKDID